MSEMKKSDLEEVPEESEIAEIPEGVLDSMPDEMRAFIMQHRSMSMDSGYDEIAKKLLPEHISKIIENNDKEDERRYSAFKINKLNDLVIIVIALVSALSILIIFQHSEHFITIMTSTFSFLGGLGIGKFSKKNTNS